MGTTHYYILPDGSRAEKIREAADMLGVSPHKIRKLVRRGQIEKVLTTNQATEYGNNTQQGSNPY